MANAKRDNNRVPTLLGTLYTDGTTLVPIAVTDDGLLKVNTTAQLVDYNEPQVNLPLFATASYTNSTLGTGKISLGFNCEETANIVKLAVPFTRFNASTGFNEVASFRIRNMTAGGTEIYADYTWRINQWVYYSTGFVNDYNAWAYVEFDPITVEAGSAYRFDFHMSGSPSSLSYMWYFNNSGNNPYWYINDSPQYNKKPIYSVWYEDTFTPFVQGLRDDNRETVLLAESSDDGTILPVYVDEDGKILIDAS